MMNISKQLSIKEREIANLTRLVESLEKDKEKLTKEKDELLIENKNMKQVIDDASGALKEYSDSLKELKQIKEKYKIAIVEAQMIASEYNKRFKNKLKELGIK